MIEEESTEGEDFRHWIAIHNGRRCKVLYYSKRNSFKNPNKTNLTETIYLSSKEENVETNDFELPKENETIEAIDFMTISNNNDEKQENNVNLRKCVVNECKSDKPWVFVRPFKNPYKERPFLDLCSSTRNTRTSFISSTKSPSKSVESSYLNTFTASEKDCNGDKCNSPKVKRNMRIKTVNMVELEYTLPIETLDPASEMSSDYYKTDYDVDPKVYLQSRYPHISSVLINQLLNRHDFNLRRICEFLDGEEGPSNAYCLDGVVLENSCEPAEGFECGICRDVVDYAELGTCDGPFGHLFCKTCIRRSAEIKIGEGDTSFSCLNNCGGVIPLQIIEEVLPAEMFAILADKIQEAEVRSANIAGIETCPFCPYAYVPDDGLLFTCSKPSCKKISCRICKQEDHSPRICEIFKTENEETARHYIENKMTEALVRECYKCGKRYVKEDGCNKITCSCGAQMCYLCRQPVTDYSHFNVPHHNHFKHGCELYSDETTLHDRPVAESARSALERLVSDNPELQFDCIKVFPKLNNH